MLLQGGNWSTWRKPVRFGRVKEAIEVKATNIHSQKSISPRNQPSTLNGDKATSWYSSLYVVWNEASHGAEHDGRKWWYQIISHITNAETEECEHESRLSHPIQVSSCHAEFLHVIKVLVMKVSIYDQSFCDQSFCDHSGPLVPDVTFFLPRKEETKNKSSTSRFESDWSRSPENFYIMSRDCVL